MIKSFQWLCDITIKPCINISITIANNMFMYEKMEQEVPSDAISAIKFLRISQNL